MDSDKEREQQDLEDRSFADRWCAAQGSGWEVLKQEGRGATASVFAIRSGRDEFALKIYSDEYSEGKRGAIEEARVQKQIDLGVHGCPSLIQVRGGGRFEGRLTLLMDRARGRELEKVLVDVPRTKIRSIVDQITRAVMFLRSKGIVHRDIKSANIFVSEDYDQAILLDLSVTRDITDPVGLGTDADGGLPVVATARYCPPEYLFRLIEPGPTAWHALDVYQLGALLCDLISGQPLFAKEYETSRNNRYRFAWTVATVQPELVAHGVDEDLILLARRATDKSWERRSQLRLEDFLAEREAERRRALQTIGLDGGRRTGYHVADAGGLTLHGEFQTLVSTVQENIRAYLHTLGVRSTHPITRGTHGFSMNLAFQWTISDEPIGDGQGVTDADLRFSIERTAGPNGAIFESTAALKLTKGASQRNGTLVLPAISESATACDELTEQYKSAIAELAQLCVSATPRES